jgi:hypothetical protein
VKLLLIAFRTGRMGNRLILFANFIAFARDQGHRVVNFAFHSYAPLFLSTRNDIYCQYPAPRRRSWMDVIPGLAPALRGTRFLYHCVHAASTLNERLPLLGRAAVTLRETPGQAVTPLEGPEVAARIAHARVVLVNGWNFRAPGCLQRQAPEVRAYFQPVEEHARASRQAVDRLRRQADVIVGVHIRRGDYRRWAGSKFFFPISRYAAWMRQLAGQFSGSRVAFLVCSEEPPHPREFEGLSVGFGPGLPIEDLYALAGCDYIFGPPSTFSQWASFYGGRPLWHCSETEADARLEKFQVSWLAEIPRPTSISPAPHEFSPKLARYRLLAP